MYDTVVAEVEAVVLVVAVVDDDDDVAARPKYSTRMDVPGGEVPDLSTVHDRTSRRGEGFDLWKVDRFGLMRIERGV